MMMDDIKGSLDRLKRIFDESEIADMSVVNVGDIIYVPLDEDDGLTLNKGYDTRRKYIVIVGFTKDGIAIGALLINSHIDPSKRSPQMINCQYPILARNYRGILDYDSWIDCSDIFELSRIKIADRKGRLKGSIIEEDKERVLEFLRESDLIDNVTKRKFGLVY